MFEITGTILYMRLSLGISIAEVTLFKVTCKMEKLEAYTISALFRENPSIKKEPTYSRILVSFIKKFISSLLLQ